MFIPLPFLIFFLAGFLPVHTMAWRCSSVDYPGLVNNLFSAKIIKSVRVRDAMLQVDRRNYFGVDPSTVDPSVAYADAPQPIGKGQTISAPHMHAHALELLEPYALPGKRVLDLGSGSGFLTAALAALVGPTGVAVGIERHADLAAASLRNVAADGKQPWLGSGRLILQHGDGAKGMEEHAPYSAIHVGAAAPRLPDALVAQLASPGRLVIPVGPQGGDQVLTLVDKDASGTITKKELFGVMYVPFHM